MVKAIKAEVNLIFFVARAQNSTSQCLRDSIFFTSQLCFCLETERKFTQVAYDNIQQDGKIHIEVPENYSFTEKYKINCSYNNLVIEMTFNGGRT